MRKISCELTIRVTKVFLPLLLVLSGCASFVNRSQDRSKAEMHLTLAENYTQNRDFNNAAEQCFEALKYDPSLPQIHHQLAIIYMETKRFQKAEDAFKKTLSLDPNSPDVLNNYGVMLNRQERFQEAISFFERALKFEKYASPENALTNMGLAYFKLGHSKKAIELHHKAIDIVPQFCLANKNLGDVYVKEKNYKKAVDAFERAAVTCPLYQESQYKLGLARLKMGQKNLARNDLEKLVLRHKSGPFVQRSQEVLKYLK